MLLQVCMYCIKTRNVFRKGVWTGTEKCFERLDNILITSYPGLTGLSTKCNTIPLPYTAMAKMLMVYGS